MASTLPVAEGGRPSTGGGLMSHWPLIAGIAGVGVVIILVTRGSSSSTGNTTAAGTSINAALGSLQEQQLNMMGQLGASTAALSSQATDYHNSDLAAMSGMQDALTAQITGLDSHLSQVNDSLGAQLGDVNNNVIANGQAVTKLGTNLDAYYTNLINAGASNTAAIQGTQNAFWQAAMTVLQNLQDQVGGVSGQVSGVSGQVSGVSGQVSGTQADVAALGRFLGWEFYQIPNRYSAYIPNQGPSNAGSSVIGSV